jgi:hypothetical protein
MKNGRRGGEMKRRLYLPLAFLLAVAGPAMAQHSGETRFANPPRANQGRIPPPPPQRQSHEKMEVEQRENGKVNGSQHVNHDRWYGRDAPNDNRYHLDHPFVHGRFEHFGSAYRYNIIRIDRDRNRIWLEGDFCFDVAPWDWFACGDWCWDCGNDFVVYEDPDHPGWYLLYNVHTGCYVHVSYLGM